VIVVVVDCGAGRIGAAGGGKRRKRNYPSPSFFRLNWYPLAKGEREKERRQSEADRLSFNGML